jgi:hypothetical protein
MICAELVMALMNPQRATVREKLLCGQRALCGAVLLLSAFTAMFFSTVVHAQIAFRSASSSTQPSPQFRAAAQASSSVSTIAYRAAGAVLSAASGNITPGLPAGWQANDLHILIVEQRDNVVSTVPAGWTLLNAANSGASHRASLWWKLAIAGDTAPLITHAAGNTIIAQIIGFSGVNTITPFDVANSFTVSAADKTVEAAAITTVTANAMLVFTLHIADNHTTSTVPAGWASAFHNFTALGNDAAIAADYKLAGAAALQGALVSTVSGAANSISHGAQLALRPAMTVTITNPAGTIQNDVMIASIGFRPNTATITPPAGWTLVRRIDNPSVAGGAAPNSLAIYSKTAGAAEPVSYAWALSGATDAVGGIQTFFNVETATSIDIESGQTTAFGITHATPSVTTSDATTMVVTSHTIASSETWTAPAGMTKAFEVASVATPNSLGQSIMGAYLLQPAAGATGVKTASIPPASPNSDSGNTHILALRPALQSSVVITKPAGTVQSDVMVATIGFRPNTLTITPPAGWTLVRRIDNANGSANSLAVYRVIAGASEPANYTWSFSSTGYLVGGILAFSGVDTTTPIDVENGNCTLQGSCASTTLVHTTPSVTTTVANTMLVTSHTYGSAGTWTPSGMTEAVDVQHGDQSLAANYLVQAAQGASGAQTATASRDADVGNAHILALRPAPIPVTAGGFNGYETSTAAGAITGVIKTKIAGNTVSVDVIALNAAKTAIGTTFTGTVKIEVLNASDNSAALDVNGCRSTWTVIQTLVPDTTFAAGNNGRKTITFIEANSYPNVRLRITYPTASPTASGCSGDNFAIRPSAFANFAFTDTDWQTVGTGRALNDGTFGTITHKAGRPLSVRATAVNAAGTPATTANYVGSPSATLTACAGAACTATFGNLTLTTTFVAGQLISDTGSYDNVGAFQLQLVDSTFAAVDGSDGSTAAERNITSAAITVGRFIPDHFAVSLNTPTFGTACGSFTYIGQKFNYTTAPVITVTAQDFANNTTTLYATAGGWWRITNASLTGKTYAAATGTLDTSAVPGTDPVIVSSGAGVGTLTFSSGTGLLFDRATPPVPAPYNADISLALNVIDADGVSYASNPASFGAATTGNGIAFSSGKPMRFGRLRLSNASGSQLISMPIRIETQYWNGAAFVTSADTCTSISTANVALGNYQKNLNSGETAVSSVGAFSGGVAWLRLSAPGAANNGSVDVSVNLTGAGAGNSCTASMAASTGSGLSHLQGAWCGTPYGRDPTARATFGVNTNTNQMIYQRENF